MDYKCCNPHSRQNSDKALDMKQSQSCNIDLSPEQEMKQTILIAGKPMVPSTFNS